MNNKITLPELVSRLASATSTTQRMSELFLRELFSCVAQALADGESVTVKDFGQFSLCEDPNAEGKRNIVFIPSKQLVATLNQPFEAFVPVELDDDISEELLIELNGTARVPNEGEEGAKEAEVADQNLENQEISDGTEISETSDIPEGLTPPTDVATTHDLGEKLQILSQNTESSEESKNSTEPEAEKHHDDEYETLPRPRKQDNQSKSSFIKGVFAGASGMLLAGLIGYWIGHNVTHSVEQADTIATQIDSIAPETVAKPIVTDTTSATMYLSRIARKHYGSADFWVYIYEENKDIINDPNNIPPGTVVVIPPAEKYGIEANNKESIDKARKRSFELFATK